MAAKKFFVELEPLVMNVSHAHLTIVRIVSC